MRVPFAKTYRHRCPDGHKILYKNIDDAFPLYIPGWQGNLDGQIGQLMGTGAVELKAEYSSRIQGLLYSLNDRNQSLMLNFRVVYAYYQSDPCRNGRFLERQVQRAIAEQDRLASLRIQIRGLVELAQLNPADSKSFSSLFKKIVAQLGGPAELEAVADEIAESRSDAQRWADESLEDDDS